MLEINISGDLKPLRKAFTAFQKKQVPWASALAVTRLAQGVQDREGLEMSKTFDSPTPFTLKSLSVKTATKQDPTAIVYPKDIAEAYLAPYVVGGKRSLGTKQGMLVPKNVSTNQYGNLTRNKLKTLKGKKGVFIGTVNFKSGSTVSGVWQRSAVPRGNRRDGTRGTKGMSHYSAGGVRTTLKLLLRFEDSTPVPRRLPFYEAAEQYLRSNYAKEFAAAMEQALKSADR